uniref:Rad21/Rec8-like protein N-terminal domain-containing protein n=1 Tax=Kalanchoe fedtschenkoi TaxID=63787 RepID=A0A7N0RII7_KALFE
MFYSHQLLARKTPLGQICEEILNPAVPMALRLSGILMGGVVIVYERKVKLLYDDVNRLLVEINEAWKVKAVQDPTMLPKGKSKAKLEAVTLSENQNTDVGETEQSLNFSNTMMGFKRTEYFSMRLEDVGESFFTSNMEENFHQADPADITTNEYNNEYQANNDFGHHFERFDIDDYEDIQLNFTSTEYTEVPTLVPSPPLQDELPKTDEIEDKGVEQGYQQSDVQLQAAKVNAQQGQQKSQIEKRGKRLKPFIMDYEQTIIPGQVFQSWLQSTSDLVGRKRKRQSTGVLPNMKLSYLMELPPLVLLCGLFINESQEIYYPPPILELWMRNTQPPQDTPSGKTSLPQPPEPPSSSAPNGINLAVGHRFEDINGRSGSIERMRGNLDSDMVRIENIMGLNTSSIEPEKRTQTNGAVTPGNSDAFIKKIGDVVRSIPSTGSGNSLPSFTSHVSSGSNNRLNRKRPYSLSGQDGVSLEPVTEENPLYLQELNFKLTQLHESDKSPEDEQLVETEPTQTQKGIKDNPVDKITDTIRMHWKTHFDTPGVPPTESLNNLTSGTRVEQKVPYGDILISRGAKM